MIICCTIGNRSGCMNMCSVRHRPIPSAPSSRALRASSGVSAFAQTSRRRSLSAQERNVASQSGRVVGASISASLPTITLPVLPSIVSQSPSWNSRSSIRRTLLRRSISSASHPATHGLPIPRATTAACEVAPPFAVSTPRDAIMPCTSSGVVSTRTRMVSLPCSFHATASSAVNTICPAAAPGDALRPLAATSIRVLGSRRAWKSWSSDSAATRESAVFSSIKPSLTMASAMRTAASALRLALRVWSI